MLVKSTCAYRTQTEKEPPCFSLLCSAFISLRNRVAILADRKRRGNIKAQRILPSCGSQATPPVLDARISPFRNNTVHALRGQKNCSRAINAVRKKTRIRVESCTAAVLSEYCSPPRSRSGNNLCFLNTLQLIKVIIPEKCESFNHSNQ